MKMQWLLNGRYLTLSRKIKRTKKHTSEKKNDEKNSKSPPTREKKIPGKLKNRKEEIDEWWRRSDYHFCGTVNIERYKKYCSSCERLFRKRTFSSSVSFAFHISRFSSTLSISDLLGFGRVNFENIYLKIVRKYSSYDFFMFSFKRNELV